MRSPVVFDMDGVLADFYAGYRRLCAQLGRPEPKVGRWDDFWDPAVWDVIKQSRDFWYALPRRVKQSTLDRIGRMQRERDLYFATSRPGVRAKQQTFDWLRAHRIHDPAVIVTSRKGEFARVVGAGYLIDDKAGNAVYTAYQSPDTKVCLLNAPYNQFDHDTLGSKVQRIDSVEEFLDLIEF